MSCALVRERLLERGRTVGADLDEHLTACADCRRLAAAIARVDDDLHGGLSVVLDRPITVQPTRRRMSMNVPTLIIAVAASLTLALIPVLPDFGLTQAPDLSVLEGTEQLAPEALSAADWADRRDQLHQLWMAHAEALPVEQRFQLAVHLGRAADLASEPRAPFFDQGDNVFFSEAIALDEAEGGRLVDALSDPVLASALTGPAQTAEDAFAELVDQTSAAPWGALSQVGWAERRDALADGFLAHRDSLSPERLMAALAQLGRAAENSGAVEPRFYPTVSGRAVNASWHAAATLEVAQPGLLEAVVTDGDVRASIAHYVKRTRTGDLPPQSHRDLFDTP